VNFGTGLVDALLFGETRPTLCVSILFSPLLDQRGFDYVLQCCAGTGALPFFLFAESDT
jgi:hypothetical protein